AGVEHPVGYQASVELKSSESVEGAGVELTREIGGGGVAETDEAGLEVAYGLAGVTQGDGLHPDSLAGGSACVPTRSVTRRRRPMGDARPSPGQERNSASSASSAALGLAPMMRLRSVPFWNTIRVGMLITPWAGGVAG